MNDTFVMMECFIANINYFLAQHPRYCTVTKADHTVPKNGHGLTKIVHCFCLLNYQIEITSKQNMQKLEYFDEQFFSNILNQCYHVTHFYPTR